MSKSIDSNKQFMIGNGLLAFGVFFIVFLFLYLGFRSQRKEGQAEAFFRQIYSDPRQQPGRRQPVCLYQRQPVAEPDHERVFSPAADQPFC